MMKNLIDQNLIDALKKVRGDIPRVMDVLGLDRHKAAEPWTQIIDKKLLTKLSPDFPLMVTICGGGSSGNQRCLTLSWERNSHLSGAVQD